MLRGEKKFKNVTESFIQEKIFKEVLQPCIVNIGKQNGKEFLYVFITCVNCSLKKKKKKKQPAIKKKYMHMLFRALSWSLAFSVCIAAGQD